jgi:hypothetical protein
VPSFAFDLSSVWTSINCICFRCCHFASPETQRVDLLSILHRAHTTPVRLSMLTPTLFSDSLYAFFRNIALFRLDSHVKSAGRTAARNNSAFRAYDPPRARGRPQT